MRLSSSRSTAIIHRPQQDFPLWDKAGTRPSLDLQFADRKDLVDATTGSNLVDFTRASSGTYVGSDGLIKTAVTNLLTYSEDFGTGWTAASGTVITTNATSNPINNLTDADKLAVGTSSFPQIIQSLNTTVANAHTFSAYVKADGVNFVQLRVRNTGATSNYFRAIFNLTDGNITQNTAFGNGTYTSGSAVSVGNGWWRLSIAGIADTSGTQATVLLILTSDEDGNVATPSTNDATDGIYLWGAQLEQSSTVGEYIPTTSTINSAPRFDHDPVTGESLGLLVEESRTNLLLQSEDFSTTWSVTNATLPPIDGLAPDGGSAGNKVVSNNGSFGYLLQDSPSLPLTGSYTYSIYAKSGEWNWLTLWVYDGTGATTYSFNLDAGSSTDGTITAVGNGWYRCSKTVTLLGGAASGRVRLYPNNQQGPSVTVGDGTSGIYIWGAQLEAGAFPTSYIPTTSSTVTRAADVASISGSNFSGWFNESEGSLYTAASFIGAVSQTSFIAQAALNSANYISMYRDGSPQRLTARVVAAGVDSAFFYTTASAIQADVEYRNCVGYKLNDFAATSNGAVPAGDLAGNVPTGLTTLGLGGSPYTSSVPLNGYIRRLTYWPARLPNETLQTITQ